MPSRIRGWFVRGFIDPATLLTASVLIVAIIGTWVGGTLLKQSSENRSQAAATCSGLSSSACQSTPGCSWSGCDDYGDAQSCTQNGCQASYACRGSGWQCLSGSTCASLSEAACKVSGSCSWTYVNCANLGSTCTNYPVCSLEFTGCSGSAGSCSGTPLPSPTPACCTGPSYCASMGESSCLNDTSCAWTCARSTATPAPPTKTPTNTPPTQTPKPTATPACCTGPSYCASQPESTCGVADSSCIWTCARTIVPPTKTPAPTKTPTPIPECLQGTSRCCQTTWGASGYQVCTNGRWEICDSHACAYGCTNGACNLPFQNPTPTPTPTPNCGQQDQKCCVDSRDYSLSCQTGLSISSNNPSVCTCQELGPGACTPGTNRCQDTLLQTCSTTGKWFNVTDCGTRGCDSQTLQCGAIPTKTPTPPPPPSSATDNCAIGSHCYVGAVSCGSLDPPQIPGQGSCLSNIPNVPAVCCGGVPTPTPTFIPTPASATGQCGDGYSCLIGYPSCLSANRATGTGSCLSGIPNVPAVCCGHELAKCTEGESRCTALNTTIQTCINSKWEYTVRDSQSQECKEGSAGAYWAVTEAYASQPPQICAPGSTATLVNGQWECLTSALDSIKADYNQDGFLSATEQQAFQAAQTCGADTGCHQNFQTIATLETVMDQMGPGMFDYLYQGAGTFYDSPCAQDPACVEQYKNLLLTTELAMGGGAAVTATTALGPAALTYGSQFIQNPYVVKTLATLNVIDDATTAYQCLILKRQDACSILATVVGSFVPGTGLIDDFNDFSSTVLNNYSPNALLAKYLDEQLSDISFRSTVDSDLSLTISNLEAIPNWSPYSQPDLGFEESIDTLTPMFRQYVLEKIAENSSSNIAIKEVQNLVKQYSTVYPDIDIPSITSTLVYNSLPSYGTKEQAILADTLTYDEMFGCSGIVCRHYAEFTKKVLRGLYPPDIVAYGSLTMTKSTISGDVGHGVTILDLDDGIKVLDPTNNLPPLSPEKYIEVWQQQYDWEILSFSINNYRPPTAEEIASGILPTTLQYYPYFFIKQPGTPDNLGEMLPPDAWK